jgi:putative endonuclease
MAATKRSSASSDARRSLGRRGELLAAEYLLSRGYQILERNVRTPYGEIDLIVSQPAGIAGACSTSLVFVEVKTRSSSAFGYPEESVTASKQIHLIHSAQAYLQDHPESSGDWRIDVIAVRIVRGEGQPEIKHFENAVH